VQRERNTITANGGSLRGLRSLRRSEKRRPR
jgi:hypothetical protein